MRAPALVASAMLLAACGSGVQQATILPRAAAVTTETGPTQRWTMIPASSRVDVVGVDIMGGKHPVTFERWSGTVTTGATNHVSVEIDMTSAQGESELVTRLLKYELLEVDRYPTATLTGRIDAQGMVEGNATIHGIEKGVRFHGSLTREGAYYRFIARFKVSRDAFGIHAKASWDGLIKDDVHVYLDVRARQQKVTVEDAPPDEPRDRPHDQRR